MQQDLSAEQDAVLIEQPTLLLPTVRPNTTGPPAEYPPRRPSPRTVARNA